MTITSKNLAGYNTKTTSIIRNEIIYRQPKTILSNHKNTKEQESLFKRQGLLLVGLGLKQSTGIKVLLLLILHTFIIDELNCWIILAHVPNLSQFIPNKQKSYIGTSMLSKRLSTISPSSSLSSHTLFSRVVAFSLPTRYRTRSNVIRTFSFCYQNKVVQLPSLQPTSLTPFTFISRNMATSSSSSSMSHPSDSPTSDSKKYNKRANLPFSIMDKEIEEYASKNGSSNVSSSNNDTAGSTGSVTDSISTETDSTSSDQPVRQVTEYEKWVRRLYATNLFLPVKLGLENMEAIHTALGNPVDDIVVVHIAGTNGKGSVTYKIAQTLQVANPSLKVGLFSSPHISSFRERMQVNGICITEEQVVELLPPIYTICQEQNIPATFFEITTALAFSYYKRMGCNVIALETGLGGRLDATNIVKEPALSIITSIGLEHTRILGDTIELIACEKGGIIKDNCPVLVGPNCPHETLRNCAIQRNASVYYTIDDVLGSITGSNNDDNDNDYDVENSNIATAAVKLLQQSKYCERLGISSMTNDMIQSGTSHRPSCRFEIMSIPLFDTTNNDDNNNVQVPDTIDRNTNITVILDVAHNPPAMEYLARKLHKTYGSNTSSNTNTIQPLVRIVVGMSADKDLKICGSTLTKAVYDDTSKIHLVQAAHPRAATIEAILDATDFNKNSSSNVHYDLSDRSITKQITIAKQCIVQDLIAIQQPQQQQQQQQQPQPILVICGSVFLMAEAREALGIVEPRDSDVISELAGAGLRNTQENFGNAPTTMSV